MTWRRQVMDWLWPGDTVTDPARRVALGLAVPGRADVSRLTMHDPRAGRWLQKTRTEMLRLGAQDTRP